MTAVFPVGIAVGCKGAAAGRAGVLIDSFPFDHVHMAVPPAVSTCVRAELFLFPPLGLDHRFTTMRAETVGCGRRSDFDRLALNFRGQSVPAAVLTVFFDNPSASAISV